MSWDVDLIDKDTKEVMQVEAHTEGGTYAIGGLPRASLNITYNYGEVYSLFGFDVYSTLHDRSAADCIPKLEKLVEKLGTRKYEKDYWAPTPGNAGHALSILLKWAKQYPNAVFRVD